jgi:putative ATP-dependent endonuclease of the OLD family
MKIESIQIENFRSFKCETIHLDDYTCLVGQNGAGKSTVLTALNIFFRHSKGAAINAECLERQDFHHNNTDEPIRITVTFTDLSAAAQDDLKEYHRLEKLIVSAEARWSDAQRAEVRQFGYRLVMQQFAPYFQRNKEGALVPELREIYGQFREQFPELPSVNSKADMERALRDYETAHGNLCSPVESSDQFYGFTKGANRLAKYVQWEYIPAVKDATEEQIETKNSSLGRLLARTVRARTRFDDEVKTIREGAQDAYDKMLNGQRDALTSLSEALGKQIGDWAHGNAKLRLEWRRDPDKSVRVEEPLAQIIAGEGLFEGDMFRFGHGLQRCVLLALLQVLASQDDVIGPTLILGIEEPELYQHPPQAKHLAHVLQKLTKTNTQVVLCTHSPFFVSGQGFADIRMVRKCPVQGVTSITHARPHDVEGALLAARNDQHFPSVSGMVARIHQQLQPTLNEMFFTHVLVLVEGIEDLAYISAYMTLTEQWDEFRRLGCHIVPVNGKENLLRPLAIAKCLSISTFVVCDSDSKLYGSPLAEQSSESRQRTHIERASQHAIENRAIQLLTGQTVVADFLAADRWENNLVMFHSNMTETIRQSYPPAEYTGVFNEVQSRYGHPASMDKNYLAIADRLDALWDLDLRSAPLERLCKSILEFAGSNSRSAMPTNRSNAAS